MSKLVLVPANMKSRGAKLLAATLSEKLGYKVYRVKESSIRKRTPFRLRKGTDKLTQLNRFNAAGVDHPEFTTAIGTAMEWIAEGTVVCRTLLNGSEGRGIIVADTVEKLVRAPLYTKYFKKKEEYRVHVLNGVVVDVQQKKRRGIVNDNRDSRIRNTANGFVFCREGLVEPTGLRQIAIDATNSLGYTLGAVDIGYNVKRQQLVVFEVNATPGMEGTTVQRYADAIVKEHKK